MAKRYELPDAAWELIADLVSPEQRMGRPRSDDRLMLNGLFWILCSGAAWRDLPDRFGPWSTVYQRFRDWRDDGTFDQVLERLHIWLWIAATIFSLSAFAANSIFCRLALRSGEIDPDSFTAIRLLGGSIFLLPFCLTSLSSSRLGGTWRGGICLFVYAYRFAANRVGE